MSSGVEGWILAFGNMDVRGHMNPVRVQKSPRWILVLCIILRLSIFVLPSIFNRPFCCSPAGAGHCCLMGGTCRRLLNLAVAKRSPTCFRPQRCAASAACFLVVLWPAQPGSWALASPAEVIPVFSFNEQPGSRALAYIKLTGPCCSCWRGRGMVQVRTLIAPWRLSCCPRVSSRSRWA